jgi:hypothetical protein
MPVPTELADGLALTYRTRLSRTTARFAPKNLGSPLPGTAIRGFGARQHIKEVTRRVAKTGRLRDLQRVASIGGFRSQGSLCVVVSICSRAIQVHPAESMDDGRHVVHRAGEPTGAPTALPGRIAGFPA